MSRTDVHRPWRVQEQDPTNRRWWTVIHNHHDGICDLSSYNLYGWKRGQRCYLNPSGACPNLCPCAMCVGWPGRRLLRRQERMLWRECRQKVLKMTSEDREDFDEGLLRGSASW